MGACCHGFGPAALVVGDCFACCKQVQGISLALGQGYYTRKTTGDPFSFLFLLAHIAGVLMKPQWDTLLDSCGRRSPLRSVFSRGKVSVDIHRVVCLVGLCNTPKACSRTRPGRILSRV